MDARRAWHVAAIAAFALAAAIHTRPWFTADRMPPGDFPGYAAQVQYVRDALLEHGRVPLWCVECYGGTTNFTANFKEYLIFPLAVAFDPVMATKLAFVLLRVIGALGLYWLVARELAAPAAGIAAGYAYSYGAIANLQIEHLDVAVATALLPFLWICAVELWRRGGARWAIALGVAMACQLANNWVHAATAPFAVLGLALVRPWRTGPDERPPWRDAALARRWALRALAAFAVFCAFAASSTAWLAADARNHALQSLPIEFQRAYYVERSPFLFANRDNVLAPWLARHQPPYVAAIADGGKRYLGGVLVGVILVGIVALRRDAVPRRYAALAGLAFLFQYWLALGQRTLLWEVAESLHWARGTQVIAHWVLRAAAAAAAFGAVAVALRSRARPGGAAMRARAVSLFVAALLLFFPTASLWSAFASLPMFAVQRSPGHFFDTAPFALSLLFATSLAALARRITRQSLARALIAAVAIGLVLDYRVSARSFAMGLPLDGVSETAPLVAGLPGEGGTLRIALGPDYSPLGSWLLAQSRAGHAWGWLVWKAGRYWRDSFETAAYGKLAEPGTEEWRARYAPLLWAARIRYLLIAEFEPAPPAPWRRVRGNGRFELWDRPHVSPIAAAYSAWQTWEESQGAGAAADALRANVLPVAASDDLRAADGLRANAPRPYARDSEPVAVAMRRPEPERMQLELDAGAEPALVFVSDGYHPWWRAEVDGRPAPVLRAAIAHMAVPVGPGRHAVELRLVRPAVIAAADGITAVAWVALALGAPIAWLIRRAGGTRPPN